MNRPLTDAVAAFVAVLFPIETMAADNELEIVFNGHCRECHTFIEGQNRLGPSLFGVVGRKAGSVPGFAYSMSLKGSGVTWDEATLDKWITNSQAVIPGNDMSPPFPGVEDFAIRKKIIAFLKSISTQGAATGE